MADEYKMARDRMVQRLRDHYKIENERVLDVIKAIPRHKFVPDALRFQAYRDNALPINGNQTISQPYIVARMTELLAPDKNDKVLEIGTGSGYQTAILAEMADRVYTIERKPQLAMQAENRFSDFGIRNVTLRCADGTSGWEAYSPYDGILVAAGSPLMPEPLLDQLRLGGRLVIPVGDDLLAQELFRITRTKDGYERESFGKCAFVPLIGEHGWQAH